MKTLTKLAAGIAITLAIPTTAMAGDFYITGLLGTSEQATDSEPYGNNINGDTAMPQSYDSGDGTVWGIGLGYKVNENIRVEGRISNRDGSFNSAGPGALNEVTSEDRRGFNFDLIGEVESTTYSIDVFYDFTNSSKFTPYVKAGIGLSDNSYSAKLGGSGITEYFGGVFDSLPDDNGLNVAGDGYYTGYADDDSTEFSWNVGVGGTYAVTDSVAIYAEYQYINFGDVATQLDAITAFGPETNDGYKIDDAAAHEVMVGVRVSF